MLFRSAPGALRPQRPPGEEEEEDEEGEVTNSPARRGGRQPAGRHAGAASSQALQPGQPPGQRRAAAARPRARARPGRRASLVGMPACGSLMADTRGGILWCPHFYNVSGSLSPHGPLLDSWPELEFLQRLVPEPKFLTS